MPNRQPQILATSGGFKGPATGPYRARRGGLLDHALRLTGLAKPRLCFLATAGGDNDSEIAGYYNAFAGSDDAIVSHLELFLMPNVPDPRAHLLAQDVIWVGGGSVANLLAVWRTHGLDDAFHEAWERGVVLAGVSAGSLCWHVGGTTDSYGLDLRPVTNGLGLLPHSNGVHYDAEEQRRPLFEQLIGDGTLPDGYATDNGVGLHYIGTELHEVLSEIEGATGYRVERVGPGEVRETVLEPTMLTG
ncbi:MAG TPA: peptidase E [Mycobacteriales bacterium]|jgi:peptidase E|nr:peptidase E [Mycobacteriales bacterium]